ESHVVCADVSAGLSAGAQLRRLVDRVGQPGGCADRTARVVRGSTTEAYVIHRSTPSSGRSTSWAPRQERRVYDLETGGHTCNEPRITLCPPAVEPSTGPRRIVCTHHSPMPPPPATAGAHAGPGGTG